MKKLILASFFVGQLAYAAPIWDSLTADQKAAVSRGEQVVLTQDVAGAPWPKVTIYQRVHSTAEEAAAVFSDYDSAKDYVPGMKKSVSRRLGARRAEIDYTVHLPVVGDENYTTRNSLGTYDAHGTAYSIDWTLVRADSSRSSEGYARFENVGTDTFFAYYNFVVPTSGMASMMKKKAIRQLSDTGGAIAARIESERTQQRALLDRQISALRAELSASSAR